MLGQSGEFYNATTEKYVSLFGTLFNNIYISRYDENKVRLQDFKVPIGYAPREKALGREIEDKDGKRDRAIQLPRISYELIDMTYDTDRALNPIGRNMIYNGTSAQSVLNPVPYNLIFELYIRTKSLSDGYKILEQILPFFRPNVTVSAHLLENYPDYKKDIPITLNKVSSMDTYEGEVGEIRELVWTLTFTLQGYYFLGTSNTEPKVIKFATVNVYQDMFKTPQYDKIEVYPGLTANGEPTTDPANTIPWQNINANDDWDYIVIVEEVDNTGE